MEGRSTKCLQLARFHADGFVIARAMFDAAETDLLRTALEKVPGAAVKAAGLRFASGDAHFTSRPFVPKVA